MLYDTLENLNQYTGLFENLDTAIAYIQSTDLNALAEGRTNVEGDDVYCTVTEAELGTAEERPFEVHSRYMDLHIDLVGTEICEVTLGPCAEETPYDEAKDCACLSGEASGALVLGPDRFAVFMVEEPHRPLLRSEGCSRVKKVVFKIAY